MINYAERIDRLPPYIFADLEKLQSELTAKGVRLISLGIGDPDLPTPHVIIESLKEALAEPGSHNYSTSEGEEFFRIAVAEWYKRRFGVALEPNSEVCILIGSKEGLANLGRVLLNHGDKALLPDPGYPVYAQGSTILSDAVPVVYDLTGENFQPDFGTVTVDDSTKLLFLNYPSNPTGATATTGTLREAVEFCEMKKLALCYDNAYSEISFDSRVSPSVLQIEGAIDRAVEFNSCSKMFNMTGYRVGFAVGNKKIISGLKKVKSQIDSGVPRFVQRAAATALTNYFDPELSTQRQSNNATLKERLEHLVEGLRNIGLKAKMPRATFYLWVNVGSDGGTFVNHLLRVGVVATPGRAFGENGTNYVRFSVTQPTNRIDEAVERIKKLEVKI